MAETKSGLATVTSVEPGRATREAVAEMTEGWRAIEAARRHAYEYHRYARSGDAEEDNEFFRPLINLEEQARSRSLPRRSASSVRGRRQLGATDPEG